MRPFLLEFEEPIEPADVSGQYNAAQQVFVYENASDILGHTTTETGTGGQGDTDSDTD